MLTINATNFGVSPADIRIKDYQSDTLVILDGSFTVDTTNSAYKAAHYLKLTVPDLPISKSRVTSCFTMIDVDGVRHIALTRCQITDKNTIRINKVFQYNSVDFYTVRLSSAFVPTCQVGIVTPHEKMDYEIVVNYGELAGAEAFGVETPFWTMLVFKAQDLSFGESGTQIHAVLQGMPREISDEIPIIYNQTLTDSLGSRYIPATIEEQMLVIEKSDAPETITKVGYFFTRMFFVK